MSSWETVKSHVASTHGIFRRGPRWLATTPGILRRMVHIAQPAADGGAWIVVVVDVGPAKRFGPARVLAAAAMLLRGKPVVRGDRLVVRAELRRDRFDAGDLDATLREVVQDATRLARIVRLKPERAQTHYSE
jgi:hypothetical protein